MILNAHIEHKRKNKKDNDKCIRYEKQRRLLFHNLSVCKYPILSLSSRRLRLVYSSKQNAITYGNSLACQYECVCVCIFFCVFHLFFNCKYTRIPRQL